jgi:hypothetical protein
MSDIQTVEAEYRRLLDEFARVGKPLLDQAAEAHTQLMNLKREAGQLFYVEYMRYHSPYTEECETLEEALEYGAALEDNGDGVVMKVYGPGVDMEGLD